MTPTLLTISEVATLTGLAEQTVRNKLAAGLMPEPTHRFGRSPVWKRSVIAEWDRTRRRRNEPTS